MEQVPDTLGLSPVHGALAVIQNADILNISLPQCAKFGDTSTIESVLQNLGPNAEKEINQKDKNNLTPLHYAARHNSHPGIIELLLKKGADVNVKGEGGMTPLHLAACYRRDANYTTGQSAICCLLSHGAQADDTENNGRTPLHLAVKRGNVNACLDLLDHLKKSDDRTKSSIMAKDNRGLSVLHLAAMYNHAEIMQNLLKTKLVDLHCLDNKKATPLHYACAFGNNELVKMLFDEVKDRNTIRDMVTATDIKGSTCLHVAIEYGHTEIVKLCKEKEAELSRPKRDNMYPIHLAAMTGNKTIAPLLLDDARVTVVNNEHATALHKAASVNHDSVIQSLLQKNSKMIDYRDNDMRTPLLLAVMHGHAEATKALLKHSADVTVVDVNNKTAVYLASENNNLKILKLLLERENASAVTNTADQSDNTPLHIAARKGFLQIVQCLLKYGGHLNGKNESGQTPLHLAAQNGHTDIVGEIAQQEMFVVNDEDNNSNTALHLAAENGHHLVVSKLLGHGADLSLRNSDQLTPLDIAASRGKLHTCIVLLDGGAPVDSSFIAVSPVHLAAKFGHAEVVEEFINRNVDFMLEDDSGNTCLEVAIENGHQNVVMTILNSRMWQRALRKSTKCDVTDQAFDTPLRKLIKKMPGAAEHVFDRCVTYEEVKIPEPTYIITFNYEFLDDSYASWMNSQLQDTSPLKAPLNFDNEARHPYTNDANVLKKNHPVFLMLTLKRETLLTHPLVTSLMSKKWNTYGRYFYCLSFFLYAIFLSFFSGFVILIREKFTSTDCIDYQSPSSIAEYFAQSVPYVIIAVVGVTLIIELFKIYRATLTYFSWTNLAEWTIYIFALLLVINVSNCQQSILHRYNWQWSVGTFAILLAWLYLLIFIQKLPCFGAYMAMIIKIVFTFIKFFLVISICVVGFALAFYVVLRSQGHFNTVGKSLIKIAVMTRDLTEFDTIFEGTESVQFPVPAYFLFVIFLIAMNILLMNMLVALAVNDIIEVQKNYVFNRTAQQVNLVLDLDRFIPEFIVRKFSHQTKTISKVFRRSNYLLRFLKCLLRFLTLFEVIHSDIQVVICRKQDDMKTLMESQRKMEVSYLRLESMMTSIMKDVNTMTRKHPKAD